MIPFRRLFIATFAVLCLALSCSKESDTVIEEPKGSIQLSLTGVLGDYDQADGTKSSTLVNTTRVAWETGDLVYVFDGAKCLGYLVAFVEGTDNRYAKLDGEIDAPSGSPSFLTFVHGNGVEAERGAAVTSLAIDISTQDGGTAPFVVYGTSNYDSSTGKASKTVNFTFATSVIRINCYGLAPEKNISEAKVTSINTKCVIDISGSGATVSGGTIGTITRTGDTGFGSIAADGTGTFSIAVVQNAKNETRQLVVKQTNYQYDLTTDFTSAALKANTSYNTICLLSIGTLEGVFTVAAGKTVRFSKGNLQYQASTGTWRFASKQTDYIGSNPGNTTKSSSRPSSTAWIDLFRYGTSGYTPYTPYLMSNNNEDYPKKSLTANTDWGRHNAISNGGNVAGLFRTLTSDEWNYLLNTRSADPRYIKATVGDVKCMLLFPDTYTHPSGYPDLTNKNKATKKASATTFTTEQFAEMEKLGVICLPTTGYQESGATTVQHIDDGFGNYWTASMSATASKPYYFYFQSEETASTSVKYNGNDVYSPYGMAVRLVTDVVAEP